MCLETWFNCAKSDEENIKINVSNFSKEPFCKIVLTDKGVTAKKVCYEMMLFVKGSCASLSFYFNGLQPYTSLSSFR